MKQEANQASMLKVALSEARQGGVEWLRSRGVNVIDQNSAECISMTAGYSCKNPPIWHEDIGEI